MVRSGGGFEDDVVAQCLQFPDVVAGAAIAVDAGFVVAGPEVDESLLRVVQKMPDDHQDGPADRDDRSFLAASAGDPSIPLTEEGFRPADTDGGLSECPGEVPVAVAGTAVALTRKLW